MKKNIIKNIAELGLGAILTFLPLKQVAAQEIASDSIPESKKIEYLASSMEYHVQLNSKDKGRINMFYDLPLNTKVYSFIELYDDDGYFFKNMIYTPLVKGFGSKIETKHSGAFPDKGGLGLEYRTKIPGGVGASVKALPLWFNKKGFIDNEVVVGYFLSKDFPINKHVNLCLSSFGEFNVAAKDGPTWGYGELDLTANLKTKVGQFDFGVGYNQTGSGNFLPDNTFRARVGYHPKK